MAMAARKKSDEAQRLVGAFHSGACESTTSVVSKDSARIATAAIAMTMGME